MTVTDLETATLMTSLSLGDEAALAIAYDRYGARVHGLALRVLGDSSRAEEVTQDVFLAAWRNRDRFDTAKGSLPSWLLACARNRSIDFLRRERGRAGDRPVMPDLPAAVDVEAAVAGHHDRSALLRAVASLPVAQRAAIEGAYFAGRTARQIAADSGVPVGTIKSRMRLGLQRLAQNVDLRTATAG